MAEYFKTSVALVRLSIFLALAACSSPALVEHSFSFDAISDSPDAVVLDYQYGESKQPAARNPEYLRKKGQSIQRMGISGEMLRPDFLYVKWRIKSTGVTYEDRVDLRKRLPGDITDHEVHFVIRGPQLYIYLVTPELRSPDMPPNGPKPYQHRKTLTIYPDLATQ